MDAGVRATQEQLPKPQALAAGEGPAHRFFSELLLLSPVRAEPVEAIFSSDHQTLHAQAARNRALAAGNNRVINASAENLPGP